MRYELPGKRGQYGTAWLGELPPWPDLDGPSVQTYWQQPPRPDPPGPPAELREGGFAFTVRIDGRRLAAGLAGSFRPVDRPVLAVAVATGEPDGLAEADQPVTGALPSEWCAGLSHESVGGVLAGATAEPWRLGQGTLAIHRAVGCAGVSNWESFRIAAVGLVRLLATPAGGVVAGLPFFGGDVPRGPAGDPRR